MFDHFYQLTRNDAEKQARLELEAGRDVGFLGLRLRYDGKERLVVTVPSERPPSEISSISAFNDVTRADVVVYVMRDTDWVAKLLDERDVELRLTDSNGKVWWAVAYGKVGWPDGVPFPVTVEVKWR